MKQTISVLLALVLTLGLCACSKDNNNSADSTCSKDNNNSADSKYIGTYECDYTAGSGAIQYTASIELLPGGTGTYTSIATKVDKSQCVITIKEGCEVETGTVTWEVSDEYLVIHFSITMNLTTKLLGKWSTTLNEPKSYTKTYELKGSKLINVERDWDIWDKVK